MQLMAYVFFRTKHIFSIFVVSIDKSFSFRITVRSALSCSLSRSLSRRATFIEPGRRCTNYIAPTIAASTLYLSAIASRVCTYTHIRTLHARVSSLADIPHATIALDPFVVNDDHIGLPLTVNTNITDRDRREWIVKSITRLGLRLRIPRVSELVRFVRRRILLDLP